MRAALLAVMAQEAFAEEWVGMAIKGVARSGAAGRERRRLEYLVLAQSREHMRQGKGFSLIEEYSDVLEAASTAAGHRFDNAVQLQRVLKAHGHADLAKRVASRAHGRHAAAHPDPVLSAALQGALEQRAKEGGFDDCSDRSWDLQLKPEESCSDEGAASVALHEEVKMLRTEMFVVRNGVGGLA